MRVVVIGGGIAGVSAAYAIAREHNERGAELALTLVEAEAELAVHTTGRSAALYIRNYGDGAGKALTAASHDFLSTPPSDLCEHSLLSERGALTVADADHEAQFETNLSKGREYDDSITELDLDQAAERFPPLRADRFVRAMIEPNASDIDVAGLHQAFVRGIRALDGRIVTSFRVDAATRPAKGVGAGANWLVASTAGTIEADIVVNAAGAWGDVVAATAGVAPIGLTPMRRTAFMVACDRPGLDTWPLAATVQHSWYTKPDGPQLLCSPANEDPTEPANAKPDELDIAIAIDRINSDTTLGIRSIRSSWAGLRTFTPDRGMALGPDPDHPDFVWCVGQGGIGIQTAPAAGRYVADLVGSGRPGPWADDYGIDRYLLEPGRFRP